MKVNLYQGHAYYYVKDQKAKGRYISYPFRFSSETNTERQIEIRQMVDKYGGHHGFCYTDYDSAELVISELNTMFDSKHKMSMPYTEGNIDWVIQLDNGVEFHLNCFDEYYGRGESETGIALTGIIVDEEMPDEEITKSLQWLANIFVG
jgi:hypothetical protein